MIQISCCLLISSHQRHDNFSAPNETISVWRPTHWASWQRYPDPLAGYRGDLREGRGEREIKGKEWRGVVWMGLGWGRTGRGCAVLKNSFKKPWQKRQRRSGQVVSGIATSPRVPLHGAATWRFIGLFFIMCMCVLMCNFVSYFVCIILCFLCSYVIFCCLLT